MAWFAKKSPSIKIPSAVLKKEAARMAKKMLKSEEQKERRKVQRERARAKAKTQVERKTRRTQAEDSHWQELWQPHFQREFWGGLWVFCGLLLAGLLWFESPVSALFITWGKSLLGHGLWLIPFFCWGLAGIIFAKTLLFPFGRILAIAGLWLTSLGMLHLLVPLEESFQRASEFGGSLGFVMTYFPRLGLGTALTFLLLFSLGWLCAMISFRFTWQELFGLFREKPVTSTTKTKKIEKTAEEPKRFHNEVEIIHSALPQENKPKPAPVVAEVDPNDELTASLKKKDLGTVWSPPPLELLTNQPSVVSSDEAELKKQAQLIREKLEQFGIGVVMKSVQVGPTVTQFTLEPEAGVKLTKITALKSDLALALAAPSLRIEAPIRGKKLVGIEIPNHDRAIVGFREILESEAWAQEKSNLKLTLGRDVTGIPSIMDLSKAPHMLVSGKTGSGKSVAINAFMISLLWQNSPEQLKFILIDPKQVELKPYNHLPHLLGNVVTRPEKATSALAWAVAEMNRRYQALAAKNVRNLAEFNEKVKKEDREPYIVIVIDELADLMMVAGKDVEAAICRIAQMARAVGMHLIVATQRPSVDVVTGLIKANLPARIAFRVNSQIDSRTIIDGSGAEDLLGFGDMLSLDGNSGELTRIQGLFVSNDEVERVTNHIKMQYPDQLVLDDLKTEESIEGMAKGGVLTAGIANETRDEDLDSRYQEAVQTVRESGKASASFLQRRLEVGYARAAKLLDQMESRGVVGPARGAKPREIYGE